MPALYERRRNIDENNSVITSPPTSLPFIVLHERINDNKMLK
jgi:hypothetical protein